MLWEYTKARRSWFRDSTFRDGSFRGSSVYYTIFNWETQPAPRLNVVEGRPASPGYRAASTTTALHDISEQDRPDDEITALPSASTSPSPAKGVLRRKNKSEFLASEAATLSQSKGDVAKGTKIPKSKSMGDLERKSAWRRMINLVKKPFSFKGSKFNEKRGELIIGSPTDFHHVQTGTPCVQSIEGTSMEPGNATASAHKGLEGANVEAGSEAAKGIGGGADGVNVEPSVSLLQMLQENRVGTPVPKRGVGGVKVVPSVTSSGWETDHE